MKKRSISSLITLAALTLPGTLLAQGPVVPTEGWHARSLGEALMYTAVFSMAGVVIAIVGYKLFDRCTPGDLHKEVLENKNVAAAIVAASVILGTCIIVAASIMG